MTLRQALTFGLALIAINCSAQDQTNVGSQRAGPEPGFSILVTAPVTPIKLNSSIIVTITVTNDTNRNIYWESALSTTTPYWDYRYDLERNGHEVETTFFHRKISERQRPGDPNEASGSPSSILLPHPPGRMFELKVDLKRLYEITEPGVYTFQVSRDDIPTKTTVRSNVLSLKIAP